MRGALWLAAALAACGTARQVTGTEVATLTVVPVVVPAGDSVTIALATTAGDGVRYNLCTATLEHRANRDWVPVPSDRVCTLELRTLLPGDRARFTMHLPAMLEGGEYRYHARVEHITRSEMIDVRSEPFTVN